MRSVSESWRKRMAALTISVMAVACGPGGNAEDTANLPDVDDPAPQDEDASDADNAGEVNADTSGGDADNGGADAKDAEGEAQAEMVRDGYGRPPVGPQQQLAQQALLHPRANAAQGDEVFAGTLRADPELDGGCLYLEVDGEDVGLAWILEELDRDNPAQVLTYWARFDEASGAELLTADGTVLAQDRWWLLLSGAGERARRHRATFGAALGRDGLDCSRKRS